VGEHKYINVSDSPHSCDSRLELTLPRLTEIEFKHVSSEGLEASYKISPIGTSI